MIDPSAYLPDGYRLEPHGEGVEEKGARWADETIADINALQNALLLLSDPDTPPRPVSFTRAFVESRNLDDALGMALVRERGGAAIGSIFMNGPRGSNPHLMFGDINVLPDHRRRGVATALLAHFLNFARSDHRTTLVPGSDNVGDAADAFAASLGASAGSRSHVNRLYLSDIPHGLVDEWLGEPSGSGASELYELEWIDGPTPQERMDDVIALRTVLLNTAPMDDLPLEPIVVTEADVRAEDDRYTASGYIRWLVLARERATGTAVAYTEVCVSDEQPRHVSQGATAVGLAHRGHGLGRWLKAEMLHRVIHERAGAEYVQTFNADSNAHMLAINHAVGFKPYRAAARWVLATEDAADWLEKRR